MELTLPINLEPEMPEVPRGPAKPYSKETKLRQLYIRQAWLEYPKIGYTGGCKACDDARAGKPRQPGVVHTTACRTHIENLLLNSDNPQHKRAVEEWLSKSEDQSCKTATADAE